MSSLSIPRPKKVSDGQFIGDLTKLLERRKIKCGDPLSLESFGSELTSNNILRSDLFTLCTAISHMADEDLSGEQLLVLVGRAVGGSEVCRGDGAVEIPDSMQSAFLSGFDAWSRRGSELTEPLAWPPPRPQLARSELLPEAHDFEGVPEPIAIKPAASGLHSLQEALEIAKKRSPTGLVPLSRSAVAGTNVDGLTISELKTLLEDIEHRMSRIQPHLSQLNSMADSPAGDTRRSKKAGEFEDVLPFRAAAPATESYPFAGRSPSLGGSLAAEAARRTPVVDEGEDAFLARHPYLRPSRRLVPEVMVLPMTSVDELPLIDAELAPVEFPLTAYQAPVAPVAMAAPSVLAPVVSIATGPVRGAAVVPIPAAAPLDDDPYAVENTPNPVTVAVAYVLESLNLSPRVLFSLFAIMLLVPMFFTGLFFYDYLHPKVILRYPDAIPAEAVAPEMPADALAGIGAATPSAAPNVAGHTGVRRAVSESRETSRLQPSIAHDASGHDAVGQSRTVSNPQSPAYVWPPVPDRMSAEETAAPGRPLATSAMSTLPVSTVSRPNHLTGPPASAIYVPSSTMIKYAISAPKPVYPVNEARGMEGTVVLQIAISKQGEVTSAHAISGPIEFRSAAVQAVRAWRFRPYLFSGTAADVETVLEVPFRQQ